MDFTNSTRIVVMVGNVFNLEKAVVTLLDEGLQANAKAITIFVNFDGFQFLASDRPWVKVAGRSYLLVIEPTDLVHHSGDVRLKYNS